MKSEESLDRASEGQDVRSRILSTLKSHTAFPIYSKMRNNPSSRHTDEEVAKVRNKEAQTLPYG